ncbi:outer membrane protein assembly factor BamB family protein [Halobiforma nitratireducens]|uniref:Pyrrolo-quinoline quinone n=1 Tax=Halobiforma nitratireducens JCM 10879 TaxID=1227454 RepID=M0MP22_9EURY|nr:PQQ-binding-like beta-propeller repeat protein [Halobiforma nitratireducens]EMA46200.1 pyrrolo-quinoline quinone [Halobiforma nitratireducens JCM 10879]
MPSLSRRRLLAVLGVGAAGVATAYSRRRDGPDCPEYVEPLREYTRFSMSGWSRPVVDDGTYFVAAGTGVTRMNPSPRMLRLLALEADGEPVWVARRELDGGIGVPRVTDDYVFASTGESRVFALDRETGRSQWTFDSGGESTSSETVVHDDIVIAGVYGSTRDAVDGPFGLVGLATADGSIEWTRDLKFRLTRGLATVDGTVVAATQAGRVVGVDPETGDELWVTTVEGQIDGGDRPIAFDGRAWVPRKDGAVVGIDPETGATVDRVSPECGADDDNDDGFQQALRVIEDLLLVGHRDGTVTAHGGDGAERWRYDGAARAAGFAGLEDGGGNRLAVLDQRGVYTELDADTGDRYRELLVVDGIGDDRCGLRPSPESFTGLATMPAAWTPSIAVTGRRGVHVYHLPARERE